MDRKLMLNILKELGKDFLSIVFPTLFILAISYIVFTIAYLLVVFIGGNTPDLSVWFFAPGILIVFLAIPSILYSWFNSAKRRAKSYYHYSQEENDDA